MTTMPLLIRRIFGILLFAIGALSSTLLTGGLTWAGVEATLYGFPRYTDERFDGLSCPLLMTRSETALVRVTVNNPSDRVITPFVTVDISAPGLPDTEEVQVTVPAGQSRQLAWRLSSDNIDRRYFIFVKANRSASYPTPEAEAICGTLVLDAPFLTGMQILLIWLALCVVCTPLGLWLWRSSLDQPGKMPGIIKALAITTLGSLVFSLSGVWILGMIFLPVIILMAVGLLRR
ncbi:MAG: hypothetical protein WA821_19600 [Anaerolineales bacterium]